MTMRIFYPFLLLIFLSSWVSAQTLPVGLLENVEDAYRRQQLLGKDSSNSSYMIRPMFMSDRNDLALDPDSSYSLLHFRKLLYSNPKFKTQIYALPLAWQQQVNSHHPYGMNDGSMVQAKGYETQISAGIYAKIGPLSIQFRPEYVYAQNLKFQRLADAPNGVYWNTPITTYYNNIDLPDRFNNGAYSKLSLGQSSIRLNAGPVSFGFSNENLWWGPGVRNSLLMSNNASGFRHLTLNTTRPIKTYIGSFEAQIVGGRLEQSGINLLQQGGLPQAIINESTTRPYDWRYFSGMVLSYQPKWVPGLFLGFDRSFIVNRSNMGNSFSDYFPIFDAVEKKNFGENAQGQNLDELAARDQYISFFARYLLPESKAEIYFQYGRNDHAQDIRDALVEPEHTRAYIVGFRKIIPLLRADEGIQIGIELTQLEKPANNTLRATPTWYIHNLVPDGYTNKGQVLGAGIGPGSNLQTLDVSWVKGLKRIGVQFERQVNNNDLYYRFAYASADKNQYINRHWVDLSLGGNVSWNYKNFLLNGQLTYIRSLNYQYQWQGKSDGSFWDWNKQDVNNIHAKIGLVYLFN
ncbi:capsule assembly Wzi family protein [Pedobacter psychrotolerans]|uniref:capsule assembly Wzi family protein n=1 Tax=Pedobacter psychrotolerans TaxID=1843235 RepID=UPI003F9DA350